MQGKFGVRGNVATSTALFQALFLTPLLMARALLSLSFLEPGPAPALTETAAPSAKKRKFGPRSIPLRDNLPRSPADNHLKFLTKTTLPVRRK